MSANSVFYYFYYNKQVGLSKAPLELQVCKISSIAEIPELDLSVAKIW